MPKDTKENKKYSYRLTSIDGESAGGSKHIGRGPQAIASRLLTRYCNALPEGECKNREIEVCLEKRTRGRNQGRTLCYKGKRVKLDKPRYRRIDKKDRKKDVIFRYKNEMRRVRTTGGKKTTPTKKSGGTGSRSLTKTNLRQKTEESLKKMLVYRGFDRKELTGWTKTQLIDTIIATSS